MYIAAIVLLLFGGCGLQIFWLCDVFYSNIKAFMIVYWKKWS
jgi:hypothetical protein